MMRYKFQCLNLANTLRFMLCKFPFCNAVSKCIGTHLDKHVCCRIMPQWHSLGIDFPHTLALAQNTISASAVSLNCKVCRSATILPTLSSRHGLEIIEKQNSFSLLINIVVRRNSEFCFFVSLFAFLFRRLGIWTAIQFM